MILIWLVVLLPTVPGAPPRRVEVEVLNSTALKVMWRSMTPGKQHGQIRGYQVHYVRVENGESRGLPLIKDVMLADAQVWPSHSFPSQHQLERCKCLPWAHSYEIAYRPLSAFESLFHSWYKDWLSSIHQLCYADLMIKISAGTSKRLRPTFFPDKDFKLCTSSSPVVALQILLEYARAIGCSRLLDFISYRCNISPPHPQPTTRAVIKASLILSSLFCLHGFY